MNIQRVASIVMIVISAILIIAYIIFGSRYEEGSKSLMTGILFGSLGIIFYFKGKQTKK